MSEQTTVLHDPEQDHWVEDIDELPPRPRRRLITPVTGALLAILLVAGGFIGGVLVQKGQNSGGGGGLGANAARAFAAAAAGRHAGGAGGAGAAGGFRGAPGGATPTIGQVTNVQGKTLYVTTTQGNTVKVSVPEGATVTRTTSSSVKDVHPGESVIVQGTKRSDGSISASSVRATSQAASGGGAAAGGAGGAGGGGSVLNQLFGSGG